MKETRIYPMYDSKDYPLYCEFITAYSGLYPEESIEDITEYFMILLCDKDRTDIHKYLVSYEIMRATGNKNIVILD